MMQSRGLLVGAGTLPWTDRQTNTETQRAKISVSSGSVSSLPDIYDAEPDALRQAQALPFGAPVELEMSTNRYRQLVVKSVRKAG